jgi:endonuclease-3 related protein
MNPFQKLYLELKNKYKKEKGQWSLWCKRKKNKKEREEIIIGAILTQRTNWKNVELALNNLKKANITSLKDICLLGKEKLAPLIRPSGFYKTKAGYLVDLSCFILKKYGSLDKMKKVDFEILRNELLKLKGIGPETADSILLYALDKPVFVVDEYTRRLVKERKLAKKFSYNFLQNLFEKNLKKDLNLYQDFHALIVTHGKSKK